MPSPNRIRYSYHEKSALRPRAGNEQDLLLNCQFRLRRLAATAASSINVATSSDFAAWQSLIGGQSCSPERWTWPLASVSAPAMCTRT